MMRKTRTSSILVIFSLLLLNVVTMSSPSSGALRACNASEKASLTKLQRSVFNLKDSYANAQLLFQKAQQEYSNNIAAGSSYGADKARIEMQRHQNTMNAIERELGKIDSARNAITKKCNPDSTAKVTSKKKTCTSSERIQLSNLSDQYAEYQYYVDEFKLGIEDEKYNYQNAISWGRMSDAARAQINIQKYTQEIQKIFVQLSLIEREFNEVNSGCKNSGISLN